jgi:hypothetical protein
MEPGIEIRIRFFPFNFYATCGEVVHYHTASTEFRLEAKPFL